MCVPPGRVESKPVSCRARGEEKIDGELLLWAGQGTIGPRREPVKGKGGVGRARED